MIVSLLFSGKGVGLFVHDVMGNFPILEVLSAFSQKAVKCVFNSNCCYNEEVLVDSTLNNLQPQSGIDVTAHETDNQKQEQNVGFVDNGNDVINSIPHDMSYTKVDTSQNVDLGDFLRRPVRIFYESWQIGTNLSAATSTFDPWYEFFNHTSIKKKLDNYYLLRCNLHLKFVINASPFYYGCCLAAYQPLTDYNPALILTDTSRNENILLSQRPHIYLYPQNSQGGEMVLPFLYHKNWLNATSLGDLVSMGTIDLQSLTTLKNANGLTTDNIYISVYAWAEDIEIAGPTSKLALQSGKDEYSHEGTISKPASAIARAANRLSDMPVLGKFATATSYAAGAVADIASLFGYTDVPVIDDVHAFNPKPYPNLAATDIGVPIEKFTLDAKNELSIDPKICGADVEDELLIKSFCSRESFVFKGTWTAADPVDTGLIWTKVSPKYGSVESITGGSTIYGTPMAHVAECFRYWRGDIKLRFKFICSQYHRGRVVINWDPIGNIGTSNNYVTEVYSRIVDISEETEIELVIPYTQTRAFLKTPDYGVYVAPTSTSTSGVGSFHNGILTIRVLNRQTSPVSSADIDILMFASGCDNLEFACPVDLDSKYSPYAPQSGQFDINAPQYEMGLKPSIPDPNINLVYMGEHCVSIRQLMRRMVKYKRYLTDEDNTASLYLTHKIAVPRAPQYPGFDVLGNEWMTGIISGLPAAFNLVAWNYTTWFSLCFVGSRGSYHYAYNPVGAGTNTLTSLSVDRSIATHTTQYTNYVAASNTADVQEDYVNSDKVPLGMSGMTLTNQHTLSGTMVSAPMYSSYKFMINNPSTRTDGSAIDDSNTDTLILTTTTLGSTEHNQKYLMIDSLVSAGTDFNLIFFLNVPTLYKYSSYPTP